MDPDHEGGGTNNQGMDPDQAVMESIRIRQAEDKSGSSRQRIDPDLAGRMNPNKTGG